jgi:hypothetical protein
MNILRSGCGPVVNSRDSQLRPGLDSSWDQHGLVSRKDGLAEGDGFRTQVLCSNGVGSLGAVGAVREGLANLAIFVTK